MEMKKCSRCKKKKDLSHFHKKKEAKDGLSGYCKPCSRKIRNANYAKCTVERKKEIFEKQRIWAENNRGRFEARRSAWHLKYSYGITVYQYEAILELQGGKCAICKAESPGNRADKWNVDHDHETKKVRGLLCERCNHAVGHARDSVDILLAAACYLESPPADAVLKAA